MKKFLFLLSLIFSNYLIAGAYAIIPNNSVTNASIIDLSTLTTVSSVICGSNPRFVSVTSDNALALITNNGSGDVTAIDLDTLIPTSVDLGLGGGAIPSTIAITPDNTKAFVCCSGVNMVSVINLPLLTLQPPIAVGLNPGGNNKNGMSLAIGIPSVADLVLVINQDGNSVTPIDIASLTALPEIPVGSMPFSIAVSKNHKLALVCNFLGNTVTPIDLVTLTPLTPIFMTEPYNVIVSESLDMAFISQFPGFVTPIQLSTMTPLSPIPVGIAPNSQAILNNLLLVANLNSNTVTAIDLATLAPLTNITVGSGPSTVAFSPGANPIALVTNAGDNTVTPINLATLTAGAAIAVGETPSDIGFFITSGSIAFPSNFSGRQEISDSLFQKDVINMLSWNAPDSGIPAFYKIFRDSALTDLVATIDGSATKYFDHNRKKGLIYSYFIVAVDSNGNVSPTSFVAVP